MRDLFDNCAAVIKAGSSDDPVLGLQAIVGPLEKNNPGNLWGVQRVFGDITAEACNNRTNEKWLTRLGGADAYGPSNAAAMLEALRLSYNILGPVRNDGASV